jgi:hypothetical protein
MHAIFVILLLLVTFFGLGTVLLADGVLQERTFTAAVVLIIYVVFIGYLSSGQINDRTNPHTKLVWGVLLWED